MYANNVELLFWPDHTTLAGWMQSERQRKSQEGDEPMDPTAHKIITGGPSYKHALDSIVTQFKDIGIEMDSGLLEDMAAAAVEKDQEESEQTMEDAQVFLGLLVNTVH